MNSIAAKTRTLPGETRPGHMVRMYEYLERYHQDTQRFPSNREVMQAGFASSTSVVRYYYNKMICYGMLTVDHGIARGIRLIKREEWDANSTGKPRAVRFRYAPEPIQESETEDENL